VKDSNVEGCDGDFPLQVIRRLILTTNEGRIEWGLRLWQKIKHGKRRDKIFYVKTQIEKKNHREEEN